MIRRTRLLSRLHADGVEFGLSLDGETLALDLQHPEFQIVAGTLAETNKRRLPIGGHTVAGKMAAFPPARAPRVVRARSGWT